MMNKLEYFDFSTEVPSTFDVFDDILETIKDENLQRYGGKDTSEISK